VAPHATSVHPCSYPGGDYDRCGIYHYDAAKDSGASTADALRQAGALSPFGRNIVVGIDASSSRPRHATMQEDAGAGSARTCPRCHKKYWNDTACENCGRVRLCCWIPFPLAVVFGLVAVFVPWTWLRIVGGLAAAFCLCGAVVSAIDIVQAKKELRRAMRQRRR